MRLIVDCEDTSCVDLSCRGGQEITDPADILAALADAGVLDDDHDFIGERLRYVSQWKASK